MNKQVLTGTLVMASLFGAKADVTLSNFEDNSLDGWQSWGGNGMAVAAAPTASLGSYSMLETVNNQYWGQLTLPNWANGQFNFANINAGGSVSFDLYFPAGWLASHANVNLELQNAAGATTLQDITLSSSLSSIAKNTVIPVSFNLGAFNLPLDASSTAANLSLYVQPGYDWMWDSNNSSSVPYTAQPVYIDNVQIVAAPEPGTIALLAAGSAGLLAFRRRAK